MNLQDVIEVENTVSPYMLLVAPNERPEKDCPVFKWSTAGKDSAGVEVACVAKVRATRVFRIRIRVNIILAIESWDLMAEEGEHEVTEITVAGHENWNRLVSERIPLTRRVCFE